MLGLHTPQTATLRKCGRRKGAPTGSRPLNALLTDQRNGGGGDKPH